MELTQDWRIFHQWLREPALRAAATFSESKTSSSSSSQISRSDLPLEGPVLVVVESSEGGPIVLAALGAELGAGEDFSSGLGVPLGEWLDRLGSGRPVHLIEASKLWAQLEEAPSDLPFLGQMQWLLGKLEFRELEDGGTPRPGRAGPFFRRWLSFPVRQAAAETASSSGGTTLERLIDARVGARFLESFSSWARRVLPRSFALLVRLEGVSGAVDGRSQALPRDAVFVFRDGEIHAVFEPDLSAVGLERRLDLALSLQVLQDRWMIPVFGLKATESTWLSWVETTDPWGGLRGAIRRGEAELLPEGPKNPLWIVLQSRKFSL